MSYYPCSVFENKNTTKCIFKKTPKSWQTKRWLKFMFVVGHHSTKPTLNKFIASKLVNNMINNLKLFVL
jgi:hypothetical protein